MATVSMAMPLTFAAPKRVVLPKPTRLRVKASLKGLTLTAAGLALTASMIIPDVAHAAESGALPPSLKNFLLSIAAGGIVLTAIIGAVVGVSNFDPVNRT